MSLILDALRRSEGGETTSVSIASSEPEALGQPRRGRAVLIVLCCLLLGVVAGWLIRGTGERDKAPMQSPTEPAGASQAAPVPESDSKSSMSVGANTARGATQVEGEPRAVASDSTPAAAPDTDTGMVANATAGGPVTEAEARQPSVAALNNQMWADAGADSPADAADEGRESAAEVATPNPNVGADPSPSIAPPIDLAAAIEKAARETGEPSLLPHPAVLLENLSQQQKDQIPTIVYTAHNFAAAGQSSVTLNQRQLRAGQRVGSIEVIEILPDSVILKDNGVVFRLRALNTWVNL